MNLNMGEIKKLITLDIFVKLDILCCNWSSEIYKMIVRSWYEKLPTFTHAAESENQSDSLLYGAVTVWHEFLS